MRGGVVLVGLAVVGRASRPFRELRGGTYGGAFILQIRV